MSLQLPKFICECHRFTVFLNHFTMDLNNTEEDVSPMDVSKSCLQIFQCGSQFHFEEAYLTEYLRTVEKKKKDFLQGIEPL